MSPVCSLPAQRSLGWLPKLVKVPELIWFRLREWVLLKEHSLIFNTHKSPNVFHNHCWSFWKKQRTRSNLHAIQVLRISEQFNWKAVVCFLSGCFRLRPRDNFLNDNAAQGGVSVNMPQFSIPPVQGVSQVSVMSPSAAGADRFASHPREKRRTISLPNECSESFSALGSVGSIKPKQFLWGEEIILVGLGHYYYHKVSTGSRVCYYFYDVLANLPSLFRGLVKSNVK